MPNTEERSLQAIKTIINKNNDYTDILTKLFDYLKISENGRQNNAGNRLAYNTLRFTLTTVKNLFDFVRIDFTKKNFGLTEKAITDYLRTKPNRKVYNTQIRHFLRFMLKENLISKNVFNKLVEIKVKNDNGKIVLKESERKEFAIPKSQWKDVYNQLDTAPKRMAAWILLNFGLRSSELLNLTINDVDLDVNELYITPDNKHYKWSPKTKAGIRKIHITKKQKHVFEKYLAILNPDKKSQYLIYSTRNFSNDKPLSYDWLYGVLKKVNIDLGNIGIRTLRPHILRYSYATHTYFNNAVKEPLYLVSKLLGQESIEETKGYLKLSSKDLMEKQRLLLESAGY